MLVVLKEKQEGHSEAPPSSPAHYFSVSSALSCLVPNIPIFKFVLEIRHEFIIKIKM